MKASEKAPCQEPISGGTLAQRGNEFHYRWVAQRLWNLLRPSTCLESVTVEGALKPEDGDDSLDAVEYYTDGRIRHIQLKHSSLRKDVPVNLSDYPETIRNFAIIYRNESCRDNVYFSIVTNRSWAPTAQSKLDNLASGGTTKDRLWTDVAEILNASQSSSIFKNFCSRIELIGDEPDLPDQLRVIRRTLSLHLPTLADISRAQQIVQIVRNHAIAIGNERAPIQKAEVLACLGVVSDEDVFPAPQRYDSEACFISNFDVHNLRKAIDSSDDCWLIHGGAGAGKTVALRRFAAAIEKPSVAILFDCFGGGSYRSLMLPRHRVKDALVQINNELATMDLCPFLFADTCADDIGYVRRFHDNLITAVGRVRQKCPCANIYILVDAADNAEMAANDAGVASRCFVDYLLDLKGFQKIDGVHFLFSSRTERRGLIENTYLFRKEFSIASFTLSQTREFARSRGVEVDDALARRMNAYTRGVPRVIANVLHGTKSPHEIAAKLARKSQSDFLTVEAILEDQYRAAKEKLGVEYGENDASFIKKICSMLAILPPDIPIEVLANASGTTKGAILDFVADFGYPIWSDGRFIRFRDEPTETWFRKKHGVLSGTDAVKGVIAAIEPLASKHLYVSRCLPHLYMLASDYAGLLAFVNSESNIPYGLNPEAMRHVKLERNIISMRAFLAVSRFKEAFVCAFKASQLYLDSHAVNMFLRNHVALFAKTCTEDELLNLDLVSDDEDIWKEAKHLYKALMLSYVTGKKEEAAGLIDVLLVQVKASDIKCHERGNAAVLRDTRKYQVGVNERAVIALSLARVRDVDTCVKYLADCLPDEQGRRCVAQTLANMLVEADKCDLMSELADRSRENPEIAVPLISTLYNVNYPIAKPLVESVVASLKKPLTDKIVGVHGKGRYGTEDVVDFCILSKALGVAEYDVAQILSAYYIDISFYDLYPHPNEKHSNDLFFQAIALLRLLDGRGRDVEWFIRHVKSDNPSLREDKELELRTLYNAKVQAGERQVKEILSASIDGCSHDAKRCAILEESRWAAKEQLKKGNEIKAAEEYMRAAGACLRDDCADARAYVKRGIELIKSSDIIGSWEVIQAIANKAISRASDPEIVYKFMRLGETVNNADGKHFKSTEFYSSLGQYSGAASIALLSRWRDRGVINLSREFPYFARDAKVLDQKLFKNDLLSWIGGVAPFRQNPSVYKAYKTVPEEEAEKYYSSVSCKEAVNTIAAWADDPTVAPKDILARFEYMPDDWKQKPSVIDQWDVLIDRMAGKIVSHGVDFIASKWIDLLPKLTPKCTELTEHLYLKAASCEDWRALTCNLLIICGLPLISERDANDLLREVIQIFENDKGTCDGDGAFSECYFPKETTMDAFARMQYAMLGAADSAERWNAAHVVRDMIVARVEGFADSICQVATSEDVAGYVGHSFPFYRNTARTYFLIAIANAARADHSACNVFVELARTILKSANHVQHIWFAESFLRAMGELRGSSSLLSGYVNTSMCNETISDVGVSGLEFMFIDGFESQEIKELASVFGLSSDYVKCKVLGEINKMMTKFCDGNPNNDVRVVAHNDWDYSEMCKLRTRNLPYISTYGYDLSYNALMVVAKDLFDRYPVVSKDGNGIEWVVWLKKHLLTRHDEKWLSEICTHVNELEEKSLLALVQNCDVKYLPINLADNNWVLVDGYLSLSDLDGMWLLVFKSIFEDSTGKRSNYFMSADWNSQGLDTLDWWAGAIVYNSVKPKFQCLNSDYSESYISSHREAYKIYRGCTVSGKLSKLSLSRMLKICEENGGRFIVDIEMRHKVYREKEETPQRQTLVLDASQIMKIRKEEYTCEMPRT